MKTLAYGVATNPKYARAFHWARLLTITGSAQLFLQAISLLSGLLIVRCLPIQEYAYYTLANTMLGTMTIFSDAGITAGVMAQGGKLWQNREGLGKVVATGFQLRKRFAVISLLVTTPFLVYLLLHHGASLWQSLFILLSLAPAFYAALSDTLLEVAPKLHQHIGPLQKNQVAAGLARFGLTVASIVVLPFAFIPIAAGGLTRMWANITLRKISNKYADLKQSQSPEVKKEILTLVKRLLPGAVFYCFSGQITIWLISIFGSTDSIAQIGALGRITMIFSVVPVLFTTLVTPRFARLPEDRNLLLLRFFQIIGVLLVFGIIITSATNVLSSHMLWVLGSEYAGLSVEVVFMAVSCSIGIIAGVINDLAVSRGIVLPPLLNIGGSIVTQIILLSLFDLSGLKNVLLFSIITLSINVLLGFTNFIYCIYAKENALMEQSCLRR